MKHPWYRYVFFLIAGGGFGASLMAPVLGNWSVLRWSLPLLVGGLILAIVLPILKRQKSVITFGQDALKRDPDAPDSSISLDPRQHGTGVEGLLEAIRQETNDYTEEATIVFPMDETIDSAALIPMLAFKTGMMALANVNEDFTEITIRCMPT